MEDINHWHKLFTPCHYSERLLKKLSSLNQNTHSPVDINEITKAIYYAKKYHGNQKRQTGEPYYSHPIEVAYMVAEYAVLDIPEFFRTDMIVTALLHDTIEDTLLTEAMISNIFGDRVSSQVEGLTRIKNKEKITSAKMLDLLYLRKRYDLAFIKIFDRIHNLQTIEVKSQIKINKIIKETIGSFIVFCAHLEIPKIEQELVKLCYKNLFKNKSLSHYYPFSFQQNFSLPAPDFQSEIVQKRILHLLESVE